MLKYTLSISPITLTSQVRFEDWFRFFFFRRLTEEGPLNRREKNAGRFEDGHFLCFPFGKNGPFSGNIHELFWGITRFVTVDSPYYSLDSLEMFDNFWPNYNISPA